MQVIVNSEEDWDQWFRQPLTQAFRKVLLTTIEETKEHWANAHFTDEDPEITMRLNTIALAGVDMLKQIIAKIDEYKLERPSHDE